MPDVSLEVRRGNSEVLDLTITQPDGSPADISGASITFAAKRHPDFAKALIRKTTGGGITIINGPGGLATVQIDAADTRDLPGDVNLYYDVRTVKAGDTDTPLWGRLAVKADVSR